MSKPAKTPITTLGTSKTASAAEPAGPKCVENSITVLKKHPETTENWSAEEEDCNAAFSKSSIVPRTPTQQCCTPPDAAGAMAPKKRGPTRPKGANATSTEQVSEQSDEVTTAPSSNDPIDVLKKVQIILGKDSLRKGDKYDLQQAIGLAIGQITAIKEELKECRIQLGKPLLADDSTRLRNIEEQLAKLTKAITEPTQTYAQAVKRNTATNEAGNHSSHSETRIKVRTEKLKRERAKTEVMLSTRNASDNMKDKVTNMSEEALTNSLQQAITAAGKEVKIRKAQKTINNGIKIRCATEQEAEELRSLDWKEALEGGNIIETLHRVVIHGVSKYDINFDKDTPEEITARIQGVNSEKTKTTAERVEPLMKRPRNPNAPTQSIVISFKCPKEAEECTEMGIHIEHRHYAITERYIPQCQIKQCFKCQAYEHKASACTKKARCGKCAQEHETRECQSETTSCANCKGPHCAWFHECPMRQQKKEEGEILRNQLSTPYI